MTPKFSIVCIAKNEARTLPRMRASLNDYVNRGGKLFLVDTGSTDGTPDLARSLGYEVTEVGSKFITTISEEVAKEINDRVGDTVVKGGDTLFSFADARNYVASLADQDFIFTMDCDEVYTNLDIDKINALIDEGYTQFEYQFCFAHDPWGRPAIKFVQSKAYDRRLAKWAGIVHETLSGNTNKKLLDESVAYLEHWQEHGKEHRGKYLPGLAYDCYLNPKNDRNAHYFAREMMYAGKYKAAIKEFERHIAMNGWPAERAQSMTFIGDCYGFLGDQEKQAEWYARSYNNEQFRREPLIKLAQLAQKRGLHYATIAYAKAALELPWTDYYANNKEHYEHIPHALLYWGYGWTGQIPKAQFHIEEALKYQPFNEHYLQETKYYFEYKYPGIEGWMTWPDLKWLYETAKTAETFVEVGSWAGRSSHAILSGSKGKVYCVDTWKGSQEVRDHTNQLAKERDMLEVFKKNVGHFPNLTIVQKPSIEAAKDFEDGSIDVFFLDAGHTEEEVTADIKAWLPKIKKGGIFAFHDYLKNTWMGVVTAVDKAFGKPDGVVDWIAWVKVK